jgi:hypothetical protein
MSFRSAFVVSVALIAGVAGAASADARSRVTPSHRMSPIALPYLFEKCPRLGHGTAVPFAPFMLNRNRARIRPITGLRVRCYLGPRTVGVIVARSTG